MKTKNLLVTLAVILLGSAIMSFMVVQDQKKGGPWTIPAEYKTKKMPADSDANQGKMLWAINCKSCHGNTGLGDGPKAASLATFPGNFKSAEFQAQTDGTIYYETITGRDEMPGFSKKFPDDEDRWNLVAFIRTLK
jgi:mono/diheme cytochrome c family protein